MGLFWAAVLAAMFHPIYEWIQKRLKRPAASSLLTVLLSVTVLAIPIIALCSIVISEIYHLADWLSQPGALDAVRATITDLMHHPLVERIAQNIDVNSKLQEYAGNATRAGIALLETGTQSVLQLGVNLVVMLFGLFFFLKDGERWLQRLMYLMPLGDNNEKILYKRFTSTSKATLKGTIFIGIIQGAIGGTLFAILGIPSAAILGLVMTLCSILPPLGSSIVWLPLAIILLVTGNVNDGIGVLIGGGFISVLDNFLRPRLVGRDIQMHPLIILLSTLGGLGAFGISGVVIGPLTAAFFFSFLDMYEMKYRKELRGSET